MTFRSLVYGYVGKGEAYDGMSYGFTFQAMSPDSTPADMALVEQSLLFPQLAQVKPDDDLVSFSYARTESGTIGVGRGISKGASYDGRTGNHVSHAIVTDDADDLGTLRPAQLYSSPIWRTELAPSRDIDPVEAPLALGDRFDLESFRELASQPDGILRLTQLVSALVPQDPEQQLRVLLGCSDAGTAAWWLAAATALLPSDRALDISFQIFVDEIGAASSRVLVVHPRSAFPFESLVGYPGFATFDLDSGRASAIPISDYASFWVSAFFENDPYDVQEAIELAGRIGGMRLASARSTALAIVLAEPTDSQNSADAALEVLSVIDHDGFEEIGQELVDRLSAANRLGFVSSATLVAQLDSLVRLGIAAEADSLRAAIVQAFGADADTGHLLTLVQAARIGHWQSSEARAAASAALAAVVAGAPDELVFELLVAGRALDLDDGSAAFTAAVPRFAGILIERPAATHVNGDWLTKQSTLVEATRMIEDRLARLDHSTLSGLDSGQWPFVGSISGADPRTYPWLTLVAERKRMATAGADERTAASRRYIAVGASASRAVLWGLADARPIDALDWLLAFPDLASDRDTVLWVCSALDRRASRTLGRTEVDLLAALHPGRQHVRADWVELVDAARGADEILAELDRPRFTASAAGGRGAELGSRFHPTLVAGRSPELASRVVSVGFADFPAGFVRGMNDPDFLKLVLIELTALFPVRPVDAALMALEIAHSANLDRLDEKVLYDVIRAWQSKRFAASMNAADTALQTTSEWVALCDAAARGGGLRGRFTDLLPRGKEKGR